MTPLPLHPIVPLVNDIAPLIASLEDNVTPNMPLNEGTSNLEEQIPEVTIEPEEPEISLRRSSRPRRPTNFDDFITYLNEADLDIGSAMI